MPVPMPATVAPAAEAQVARCSAAFLEAFTEMARVGAGLRALAPLPAHLTTITMTGRLVGLNVAPTAILDTVEMSMMMADEGDETSSTAAGAEDATRDFVLTMGARAAAADPSDRRQRPRLPFSNSIIARPRDPSRRTSLKLFHNGSIQAAGCPSPAQFRGVASMFCEYLRSLGVGAPVLEACTPQMINVNVTLRLRRTRGALTVRMRELADAAQARWPGAVTYHTEMTPGLKLSLRVRGGDDGRRGATPGTPGDKDVTVQVFRSGIVCFKGAKRPEVVGAAYAAVLPWLDSLPESTWDAPAPARPAGAGAPYAQTAGYPHNSYVAAGGGA